MSDSVYFYFHNLCERYLPNYLYKYYGNTMRLLQAISGEYIHFENSATYNDMFDGVSNFNNETPAMIECNRDILNKIADLLNEKYKSLEKNNEIKRIKNFQFEQYERLSKTLENVSAELGAEWKSRILEVLKNQFAYTHTGNNQMSCFSSKDDSILMWSHYGKSLKGGCLIYDTTKDEKLFKHAYPVFYDDNRAKYNGKTEGLFVKAKEWSYENEWRIIADLKKVEILHTNACCGVIIGTRMDKTEQDIVKEIAKSKSLVIFYASPDNSEYKINILR